MMLFPSTVCRLDESNLRPKPLPQAKVLWDQPCVFLYAPSPAHARAPHTSGEQPGEAADWLLGGGLLLPCRRRQLRGRQRLCARL